jgi:hypothetical protein
VADIKSAADDDLPRLPDSLIDAVNRRFDTLSSAARDLLRCASIFGPRFSVAELSATLRTPAFEMLDVVHELIGTGVVVADVDRLAFGHCVTRDAIYESIPPSARQALHLEAAHALARTGAPIERVAEHLLSAQVLDSESLAWITAAADRLSLRAPELAVGLFHQALELANPADPQATPQPDDRCSRRRLVNTRPNCRPARGTTPPLGYNWTPRCTVTRRSAPSGTPPAPPPGCAPTASGRAPSASDADRKPAGRRSPRPSGQSPN